MDWSCVRFAIVAGAAALTAGHRFNAESIAVHEEMLGIAGD